MKPNRIYQIAGGQPPTSQPSITMKRFLSLVASICLLTSSYAQLWNGDPLPPAWGGSYSVDPYFVPVGALSEFDSDSGYDFSLDEGGNKPIGITEVNGWFNSASFALSLGDGDSVRITYLGKTAGWDNDFGINLGGMNATGAGAFTIFEGINSATPGFGSQTGFSWAGDSTPIDFWLNSAGASPPALGGTYSMFFPGTSDPSNTGLPAYDYSARGRVFNVNDSLSGFDRSILVLAVEDWRNFDADFTDFFFAIEVYDREGNPQFPVPEPSAYGLIGAMVLLGLVAVRRKQANHR